MALVHQFAIISKESTIKIVSADMDCVEIPDDILEYIADTLEWITSSWNGKELKQGISYYGFSIIEGDEIIKLMTLIQKWKELFELAPGSFRLTGSFSVSEKDYEKKEVYKSDIIKTFDSWLRLCKKALDTNSKILHNGI